MKALVIGGTGPSGPHVIRGLQDRGYEVTILHRGIHEPEGLPDVPHIHADPHFAEPVAAAIGGTNFDVVVAMYGRTEVLANVFAGRCARFIAVGGRPIYAGYLDPASSFPRGMKLFARESDPVADPSRMTDERASRFAAKMIAAEKAVLDHHAMGSYRATILRYPYIYGPRSIAPLEWSFVRRIRDGHDRLLLPNAGLAITARCAAENAAHALVLAVEAEAASGEIFNVADEQQFSLAQWVELIASIMKAHVSVVDVPTPLRWTVAHLLFFAGTATDHAIADISKARSLLGYRDVISPPTALARMVDWMLAPGTVVNESALNDRFDYALEERVGEELEQLAVRLEEHRPNVEVVHGYAHPKAPSLVADHRGR